jgi:putative cell wall-binding protein
VWRSRVGVGAVILLAPFSIGVATADTGTQSVRLAGNDRFETAVAISRQQWPDNGAFTVYLANGVNPADALALGASTLFQGPILLVPKEALPAVVGQEISRLRPCRIVVAGGPASIADGVFNQAKALVDPAKCSQAPGG